MRRQPFGLMLVAGGALAGVAARAGQGQDFSKVEIKAARVAGNDRGDGESDRAIACGC